MALKQFTISYTFAAMSDEQAQLMLTSFEKIITDKGYKGHFALREGDASPLGGLFDGPLGDLFGGGNHG